MRVKPAPGMTVRDPRTMAVLPEEGREVSDDDLFWARRIRDGDVVVEDQHHTRHRAPAKEA